MSDLSRFKEFIFYSVEAELKLRTVGSYLGYMWWILDPLMYMLVYAFVIQVILQRGEPNFPLFVLCATLPWSWVSKTLGQATGNIKSKRKLLQQVYLPKFVLPVIQTVSNSILFVVGTPLLIVTALIYKIPLTLHVLEIIPILVVQFLFILGFSILLAHIGVFFDDINNILTFTLRFWFYISPCLYSLDRIPETYRWLWWLNPMTTFFTGYRNIIMFGQSPSYIGLAVWAALSLVLIAVAISITYRFDKHYAKVT